MASPDISVIICVKNGAKTIEKQLTALADQTALDNIVYEVVVADNGSQDLTRQVIDSWWTQQISPRFELTVIDANHLKGIPAVRNFAAQKAKGQILAFCDADDVVSPQWVAAFHKALNEQKALAGGWIRAYEKNKKPRPEIFGKGLIATVYLPHVGNCNCAISRSLFFEVGGYDEALPKYGFEDVDLSWRVQEAGYPLIFVEEAEIAFTVSDTGSSLRKKFLLGQGRVMMARRYPAYDANTYNFLPTLKDTVRSTYQLAADTLKKRNLDRRQASVLVAQFGKLYGAYIYRGKNYSPQPKLMTNEH